MSSRPLILTVIVAVLATACERLKADEPKSEREAAYVDDGSNWLTYARDPAGTRFSELNEINEDNVASLARAWSYRARPEGGGIIVSSATPIVIDGIVYYPVGDAVVALEGHSGKEIWRHPVTGGVARRTVSYWPGDANHPSRLFYSTGSRIVAISPVDGSLDETFAASGAIELDVPYNAPPSVFKDVLVIGANVNEMQRGQPGNSRAFDARTGEKLWEFNTVPRPGETGHETWLDDGWKNRSGTNVWVWYMTFDEATDTVYMTVGSPSANYYGGDRPGDNLFGNSLVALDLRSGALRWYFQAIHHELWDWDLPAPPVLVDLNVEGGSVSALALIGKNSLMYILDRNTGEPVFGVDEVPVEPGNVPGEWYSPTQPVPVKPPPLSRIEWTSGDVVSADDTNEQHAANCLALLDAYGGTFRNTGPFTHFLLHEPGDEPRASINLPHNGGVVWGGAAADPKRGLIFVNTSENGSIGWIEERDPGGDYGRGTEGSTQKYDRGSLIGPGAYSSFSATFETDEGRSVRLPCIRPPWGHLYAIDGNTGEVAWKTVLGVSDDLPEGRRMTGTNNGFGGPIVTAGGLVFIGATNDRRFRAFSADSGEELWTYELAHNAQAIPVTYRGADGSQYVAVTAASFGQPQTGPDGEPLNNEALVAFALPDDKGTASAALEAATVVESPQAGVEAEKPALVADFMNVYRRFEPEVTEAMVAFYSEALGRELLTPIDLGGNQQMILIGNGSGQIKLAAGLKADRRYQLGTPASATGIRMFALFVSDEAALIDRFVSAGFPAPHFEDYDDGTRAALLTDPGGFPVRLVSRPAVPGQSAIEIHINVSDLDEARAFYGDFIGLDPLQPVSDSRLGTTVYPYRHGETVIKLWSVGSELPADTGSAGIQYIVSNVDAVNAYALENGITIETPLGGLAGFDLRFVWLNDPDGVTNYFAQLGAR